MMLSDQDILTAITAGALLVEPPLANTDMSAPAPLQPASIEVTLAPRFLVPTSRLVPLPIDPRGDQAHLFDTAEVEPGQHLVLPPGGFVLGCTEQTFGFSATLAGQLEGKSSLARLGLQVHSTAGFVDPGFHGQITLELSNQNGLWPIGLWPGMRIGQMFVFRLSSPAMRPYGSTALLGSRYQGQMGPTATRPWARVPASTA